MGVAVKIGEVAKERNISLKELSRRADIPYTTLYHAVKRDSKMDFETVQKIADALNADVSGFYPDEGTFKSEGKKAILREIASPKNRADTIIDCLTSEGVKNFLEYGDMLVSNDKFFNPSALVAPVDAKYLTRFGGTPDADDKEPAEK